MYTYTPFHLTPPQTNERAMKSCPYPCTICIATLSSYYHSCMITSVSSHYHCIAYCIAMAPLPYDSILAHDVLVHINGKHYSDQQYWSALMVGINGQHPWSILIININDRH